MSANTSTEGKEKKELKITRTDDAEVTKLIDKYFEDFIEKSDKSTDAEENTRYVLSTHALIFTTKDQNVKSQLGDNDEKDQNFVKEIDVKGQGKKDFDGDIKKGVSLKIKLADKDKVKARADKIRKENAKKNVEKNSKKSEKDGAEIGD